MQYGVCCGLNDIDTVARAGYDFAEGNVQRDLVPTENEAAFAPLLTALRAGACPVKVANCFLPGSLKVTGPAVDWGAVERYVSCALERAKRAGIEVIVFGSGGARAIPDGFDRNQACRQLIELGKLVAPRAAQQGVTIAVEPLNKAECNVLTTVSEAADYVRRVDHPAFRLLVDAFHWYKDGDTVSGITENGDLFAHVHIATMANRRPPGAEPHDFSAFFAALRTIGYRGRLSIECGWQDLATQAPVALATVKAAVKAAARQ